MYLSLYLVGLSFLPEKIDFLRGGKRVSVKGLRKGFTGLRKDRNGFKGVDDNGVQLFLLNP